MEISEELGKVLELSEEEQYALSMYTNAWHYMINVMLNTNIDWEINVQKENHVGYSEKNIHMIFSAIKNMYSAMYKYWHTQNDKYSYTLHRGTSKDVAKSYLYGGKGYKINRMLSTSFYEEKAMEFSETGKGAIIHIDADKDVPYIDVNDILRAENNSHPREAERIYSPFTQITRFDKSYSKSKDIVGYEMHIENQMLEILSDDEKNKNMRFIIDNISQMPAILKSYEENRDKISFANDKLEKLRNKHSQEDVEERKWHSENLKKAKANIIEPQERYVQLKDAILQYIKGECKEVEVEINRQIELANKQSERKKISELNNTCKIGVEVLKEEIKNGLKRGIAHNEYAQEFYGNAAKEMGIEYASNLGEGQKEEINNEVERIEKIFKKLEERHNSMNRGANKGAENLTGIAQCERDIMCIDQMEQQIKAFNTLMADEENVNLSDFKKSIADKVAELIAKSNIAKIEEESKEYMKKSTVIDKLMGRDKVKEIKLRQSELKKEIQQMEMKRKKNKTEKVSIHEVLAEADAYLSTAGADSEDVEKLKELRKKVLKIFNIDEKDISKQAIQNINKPIPVEDDIKKVNIFNRRDTMLRLMMQTTALENTKKELAFETIESEREPFLWHSKNNVEKALDILKGIKDAGDENQEGKGEIKRATAKLFGEYKAM